MNECLEIEHLNREDEKRDSLRDPFVVAKFEKKSKIALILTKIMHKIKSLPDVI